MTDPVIFIAGPQRYGTYHIEIDKNDGEEGGEGFYLLGEVAESGSPFKRWVDVGAGFLKKKILNS